MIQDIKPYVFHNEYRPQRPEKEDYVLYFEGEKALAILLESHRTVLQYREIVYPTFAEVEMDYPMIYDEAVYLFAIDERRFYLAERLNYRQLMKEQNCTWIRRSDFRFLKPDHLAFAGITAYQLQSWYQSRQFCGRGGGEMQKDTKERMLFCPKCRQMEYPKICPAVIVGVTDKNRLLLTKYAGREYKKYALIAGFTEIGESIEGTVRREVMEEVGLKVKNITFYKSQPWSFSDTLLLGFYAEADGATEICMDEEELSVAEWFERKEIPESADTSSLTNEMIQYFKNKKG